MKPDVRMGMKLRHIRRNSTYKVVGRLSLTFHHQHEWPKDGDELRLMVVDDFDLSIWLVPKNYFTEEREEVFLNIPVKLQVSTTLETREPMILYRSDETGMIYARPLSEFTNERFQVLL